VQQFRAGQKEQSVGTWERYQQEYGASEFGMRFVQNSKCCGLPSPCRFKFVHRILAYEAAFPLRALSIGGPVSAGMGFILGQISSKFLAWFWDKFYDDFHWPFKKGVRTPAP
jgi:hypothetical protein